MKFYFTFMLVILSSCRSVDKLSCYEEKLQGIKSTNEYDRINEEARIKLPLMKGEKGLSLFRDSTYIDSSVIDDAVFFNKDKNLCLLLILQQTDKSLYLDRVRIIQGEKIGKQWKFLADRMPTMPEIIFTVQKTGPPENPRNNSIKKLSAAGREFVLEAGMVSNNNCNIDEKYWFGKN